MALRAGPATGSHGQCHPTAPRHVQDARVKSCPSRAIRGHTWGVASVQSRRTCHPRHVGRSTRGVVSRWPGRRHEGHVERVGTNRIVTKECRDHPDAARRCPVTTPPTTEPAPGDKSPGSPDADPQVFGPVVATADTPPARGPSDRARGLGRREARPNRPARPSELVTTGRLVGCPTPPLMGIPRAAVSYAPHIKGRLVSTPPEPTSQTDRAARVLGVRRKMAGPGREAGSRPSIPMGVSPVRQ